MCGENQYLQVGGDSDAGSSPRVRGKLHVDNEGAHACGLIPACAGKTFGGCLACSDFGAHPRVCGENARFARWVQVEPGSSPRVRGKLGGHIILTSLSRLIPACAGKTYASNS